MTKLSRAAIAYISATIMFAGVASIAGADTFTYTLDNTLAEANGGPPLVSYGGTLGNTGYTFGVQQGLSLSGTGIFDVYSIDIHFYFSDVNASFNGYERILDFKNRTSDSGLYSLNGSLVACTRFRRHRVRCFDGAGGGSWRDGSSRGSSSLRPCG